MSTVQTDIITAGELISALTYEDIYLLADCQEAYLVAGKRKYRIIGGQRDDDMLARVLQERYQESKCCCIRMAPDIDKQIPVIARHLRDCDFQDDDIIWIKSMITYIPNSNYISSHANVSISIWGEVLFRSCVIINGVFPIVIRLNSIATLLYESTA